jgi:hypothetical protein
MYKFKQAYSELKEVCPPESYKQMNINPVYRYVFKNGNENANFTPQYYKNPNRFLSTSDSQKCKALGLSFFSSEVGAVTKFNQLLTISPNLWKSLGNNLASGRIEISDGVNGDFGKDDHFTHHSFENVEYDNKFESIKSLV